MKNSLSLDAFRALHAVIKTHGVVSTGKFRSYSPDAGATLFMVCDDQPKAIEVYYGQSNRALVDSAGDIEGTVLAVERVKSYAILCAVKNAVSG